MWGSSSKSKNARIETLVGRNTEVTGDIKFSGGVHVDGTVRGNVVAEGDGSVVSVSQHGVIEGDLKVPHIVLDGTVTGDVHASERLELAAHAKVNGDVYYNLIEMAVGASVNGKMVHRPADKPLLLEQNRQATGAEHDEEALSGETRSNTGG
jgi:cytoskeletal protein CcmA (bactofilin family)